MVMDICPCTNWSIFTKSNCIAWRRLDWRRYLSRIAFVRLEIKYFIYHAFVLLFRPFKYVLYNYVQMLDMIKPEKSGKISLSDLKKCKMTSIFFDTFFNLEKYLDHEQRDPFASAREHDPDGHEVMSFRNYQKRVNSI